MTAPCRLAELGLVTEGALRMAPLMGLPLLISDHGLDAATVIRDSGCDPALFADPENTIDFSAVGRLLTHVAAVAGIRYPGLELGRPLGLDVLGSLSQVLRLAPDIGTALRTMILYFHLHDRGAIPSLWQSENQAMLGYTVLHPDIPGTEHIYDAALAIAINFLRELGGKEWKATRVDLFRDQPDDPEQLRSHFQSPLHFGARRAGIVFPASDLARPLPDADPPRYAAMLRKLDQMDGLMDDGSFSSKVRRVLRRLFVSGSDPRDSCLEQVAKVFSVHPRTLVRRLQAEEQTFSHILAEVRYEFARQLLRDTRLDIADIAVALGYADSASFDHAFRKWSGTTATSWRGWQRANPLD